MTKKELEEIRDQLSEKHANNYFDSDEEWIEEELNTRNGIIHDCNTGFDACAEILLPIIKDYEEALEFYAGSFEPHYKENGTKQYFIKQELTDDLGNTAREVLKKHRGSE